MRTWAGLLHALQARQRLEGTEMGTWTRRDLVKAGLAASAGVMTGNELLAEPRAAEAAAFMQGNASQPVVDPGNPLRERLLLDFGWRFALGNANAPDKDFGFGKLRGTGTFAKSGAAGGPAAQGGSAARLGGGATLR